MLPLEASGLFPLTRRLPVAAAVGGVAQVRTAPHGTLTVAG